MEHWPETVASCGEDGRDDDGPDLVKAERDGDGHTEETQGRPRRCGRKEVAGRGARGGACRRRRRQLSSGTSTRRRRRRPETDRRGRLRRRGFWWRGILLAAAA